MVYIDQIQENSILLPSWMLLPDYPNWLFLKAIQNRFE
jgi:hypothetical protein